MTQPIILEAGFRARFQFRCKFVTFYNSLSGDQDPLFQFYPPKVNIQLKVKNKTMSIMFANIGDNRIAIIDISGSIST